MKKIVMCLKTGMQILLSIIFFLSFQDTGLAEIPKDSFRILAIHEKDILVPAIFQYHSKTLELSQDLLNLRKDKEWVNVKIMHIEDQNRNIPHELKEAGRVLKYKIQLINKKMIRLNSLNRKHLADLLKLDSRVKGKYGSNLPAWWSLDDWVLKLLYPGLKPVEKKNKTASVVIGTKVDAIKSDLQLVKDIQGKIKAVELGNWVELISGESRLRLEVQLPILFGSGKTTIAKEYKKFFKKLAWLLKPYQVQIEVAGFTDGSAISGGKYSSNIELGVSRAANVVKELVETGLKQSAFKIVSQGVNPEKNQDKDKLSAAMKRRVEVNVFFDDNEA